MVLTDISEKELEKYIVENLSDEEYEEYDSRKSIKRMLTKLDKYIDSLKESSDELKKLFSEDIPNSYFIKKEIVKFNSFLKKTANKSNEIGLYSGCLDKKDRRDATAVEVKFSMAGERLHITFPTLLPKKIERVSNSTAYTSADIRQMYEPAFNKFFSNGRHIIYSKKAAIIYTHYFTSEREFIDHDNFETKIVTDLITGSMLLDDSPKHCAILMDYKMGEYSHTEVDVIPFDELKSFL